MYFVEGIGYVYDQFTKNNIRYSKKCLDNLTDTQLKEFGAYKKPEYDPETQILKTTENGWVIEYK